MNPLPIRESLIDLDAHPPLCPMIVDHIGKLTQSAFFDRIKGAGVLMVCGRLTPPPGFFADHAPEEAVLLLNRGALELAAADSRYLPALWIHPDCPGFCVRQLEEYAGQGVRMIGVDADHLDHPGLIPILTRAQSVNMTVMLHNESISQAESLAAQYPALHLLIGGLNSTGYMPASAFDLLQAHSNLSINLSGACWGWNYVMHEWTERLGPDRLYYGTGYPFCNPAAKAASLQWELRDQPDSVKSQIFRQNALALLGAEGRL